MKKKLLKGVLLIGLVAMLLVPCFTSAASSNAKTLGELKKELADYKKKVNSNAYNQQKTSSEINAAKNTISAAEKEIEENQQKIEEAKKKIKELNVEIDATEEEIKDLLRAYEIASGDNNYLEYIFGATSMSDFIIRYSISEQLANYNDGLITDYENKIDENEKLKKELADREVVLNQKIEEKEKAIESLGNKLSVYEEEAQDLKKQVSAVEDMVNYYTKQGCKDNDLLASCVNLMTDTGFVRPLNKGMRTSNFGYRTHPVTGVKNKFHSGVDIGGNVVGTKVYAIANGKVGMILKKQSCGGNMVYIYHNIGGQYYTSTYMHLYKINVKVGDAVSPETVIGTVGGDKAHTPWDGCSTGAHLHLSLAKGWYGQTYVSYSKWVSNLVDPGLKKYVNIPALNKWFSSRTW